MGSRIELVEPHYIAQSIPRLSQFETDMLCFLFQDPLVGRQTKLFPKLIIEIRTSHPCYLCQIIHMIYLQIIFQY